MQPRRDFDEKSLKELADSIKLHDVIQPITVIKIGKISSSLLQVSEGARR